MIDEDLVSAEQELRVEAHIALCETCAKELESFYENCDAFPEREWQERKESFLQRLKATINPLLQTD